MIYTTERKQNYTLDGYIHSQYNLDIYSSTQITAEL